MDKPIAWYDPSNGMVSTDQDSPLFTPLGQVWGLYLKEEAKDEPVKLRRGDILRCMETDELCTVWATSTSGKTLVKWGGNDFTDYTAEQIGELFWIEPKEQDEKDGSSCPEFWDWLPKAYRNGDADDLPKFTKYNMEVSFLAGKQSAALEAKNKPVAWMCADESLINKGYARFSHVCMGEWKIPVYTIPPQRTWVALTDEEISDCMEMSIQKTCRAIEAKLKEKNT